LAKGWIEKNPFLNFKSKIIEVERAFLSEEEIERLENKVFSMERLNTVKQLFLFSCYTGLAFIDVQKLTPQNVVIGIDGKHWINTHRTKTETASNIPLLPPAMAIINQFKEHPQVIHSGRLLPVPSNQKMNAYLKEIADLCEINKPLTFHVARHTFATTITLTNGIPIESVSKMLGHRSLRTTQHYAKILDKKVSADMEVLFSKMNKKTAQDDLKKMA
jgi:integrase